MLTRVNEILIGKDIDRTAANVAGASMATIQTNIASGELLVLDSNFKIAPVTITYATSDVIYIVEGTDETFNYTNEAGTAFSGKRLIVSNPIDGRGVKNYNKVAYVAKTEKNVTFGAITGAIVAGTEYVLRIVYKDIIEHPGQFTETYRYVAKSGDASVNILDGLRKRIAKYTGKLSIKGGARISTNALAQATLVLTAKAIPECTSSINDIDELTQVDFEAFLNYVDNDGVKNTVGIASGPTYVTSKRGSGVWEVIRDTEKKALSYKGIDNRIWFPITKPDMRTQKGGTYNVISIEHDKDFRSADNQYIKNTPLTTVIAIEVGLGAPALNQGDNIEDILDAWMASLPSGFSTLPNLWV